MKVLHLTLRKKWFDMIASGEKTEEYREIKPYWEKRFFSKGYDLVHFRNGYSKNSPSMTFELSNISIKRGQTEWGAYPGKKYYVLTLGKRI